MKRISLLFGIVLASVILVNSGTLATDAKLSADSIKAGSSVNLEGTIEAGRDLFVVICTDKMFSAAEVLNPKEKKILKYTFGSTAIPPTYYMLSTVPEKLATQQFMSKVKINKIKKWGAIDPAVKKMLGPVKTEKQWKMLTFMHENKIGINILGEEKPNTGDAARMIMTDYGQQAEKWNEGVSVSLDKKTGEFLASMSPSKNLTPGTGMAVYVNGQKIDSFTIKPSENLAASSKDVVSEIGFGSIPTGFANSTPMMIEPSLSKTEGSSSSIVRVGTLSRSVLDDALPYAELSAAIYDCKKNSCKNFKGNEGTWNLILDSREWVKSYKGKDDPGGFHAAAYRNAESSELAIVYEGTADYKDWLTDLTQPLPFLKPLQFSLALEFAKAAKGRYCVGIQECQPEIVLTGHSLGGGLAQFAALNLGKKAYVFNSSGLWGSTAEDVDLIFAADARINHFSSQGYKLGGKYGADAVPHTGIQFPQTNYEIPIDLPWWSWDAVTVEIITHNMERLREAMFELRDQMPLDEKPGFLKAISLFKGSTVKAKGSCSQPDYIGLFGSAGALIFFPSKVLFVASDDTASTSPLSYNNLLITMNVSCKKLLPQHYAMFGEAIAMLEASDKILTSCMLGSEKTCINSIFQFADVTGDGQLTVAEVARIMRGLAFYVSSSFAESQAPGQPVDYGRIYVGASAVGILGPVFAKNLIASVDFDGNGAVSLEELLQDREPDSLSGSIGAIASTSTEMVIKNIMEIFTSTLQLLPFLF